ncbi:MAG: heparinase II/III family protein, partial [Candidatus Didemnitutus sp.]|nr:heparinase II/III family protein [Candidatus Didemnitutus sp.]
ERKFVLDHFRERGNRSVEWIERTGSISKIKPNSIESDLSSHPVRFMPMTGLTALALWDDLPEARQWWNFAYTFYRDQFTPWGGDDGGWGEGVAYWRGTMEHAFFQDALLAIGDPQAYATPFWKNSPYFCLYNVQPYLATSFGDLSNAGKFNLESAVAEYLLHLARVNRDGYLRTYADLSTDRRPRPTDAGLKGLDRRYPTAAEFLLRNFTSSSQPLPEPKSLAELPSSRWFRDVGWVSMHSALGQPAEDVHVTFVSSPYGSFSHSHGHQNGFVLNAYGAGLAVNSGFREWHNSPHHEQWVRQTISKNAVLIDGAGQKTKSKASVGEITRFEQGPRYTWTTGDATKAYALLQPKSRVKQVTRDLILIDGRYVVVRDVVVLATPGKISWLLHTERPMQWDARSATAFTQNGPAALTTKLVAPFDWSATVTEGFEVEVDPKYVTPGQINYSSTGEWNLKQNHLTAESQTTATRHEVYAVLWPEKNGTAPAKLQADFSDGVLVVNRPDGKQDRVRLGSTSLQLD